MMAGQAVEVGTADVGALESPELGLVFVLGVGGGSVVVVFLPLPPPLPDPEPLLRLGAMSKAA